MEKQIFWHQGLFLQPQHLQLNTQYCEALNIPLKRYLQPHFWGVGEFQIQAGALANRSFHLNVGTFLFPDTTFLEIPHNALVMPRSFDGAWDKGSEGFGVYLGLRKFNPAGKNVTVVTDLSQLADVNTRWVTGADSERVPDLHHDGPDAQLQRLYYVAKIFWAEEKERLGDYELIPLAWLERDQENIRLSKEYIPPCISIGAEETLLDIVKDIRDQIGARSRQLEGYKRDRGLHSAEFGARDMVYLLALRSLNRYAPLLAHLTSARHGHPWHVYGLLRQLIGELSTFAGDISYSGEDPGGNQLLPDYDHVQIGPCFNAARALVTRLLDQITAGPEFMIKMLFDGTYFAAELPPNIFEGRNRFFLVIETESDSQPALQSILSTAKLSSRESMPLLIARALSGIGLEHLPTVPQELPRRARALYFQIDHHGDQWAQVQKSKNLVLYWDTAPEDLKAEFMCVGRR